MKIKALLFSKLFCFSLSLFLIAESASAMMCVDEEFKDVELSGSTEISNYQRDQMGQQLLKAIQAGEEQKALTYIQAGANVNYVSDDVAGDMPLYAAVSRNLFLVIQALLEAKADVNQKKLNGSTSLHLAVEKQLKEVVWFLIRKGANPKKKNGDKKTAFEIASADMVQVLDKAMFWKKHFSCCFR